MAEDIKPIVPNGSSGFRCLDAVFEVLVRAGRNAPDGQNHAGPESLVQTGVELPRAWRDMYSYCNSVMEPWDGPAALAMTDGRWVCAVWIATGCAHALCRDRRRPADCRIRGWHGSD